MRAVLRAEWAEPRAPDTPRRVWRDWALVIVLVPTAVLEGILREDLPWRPVSLIVGVALIPTLLWRRTEPLLMVAIAFGTVTAMDIVWVTTGGEAPGLVTQVYMLLLPYSLFRWGSGREVLVGLPIMLVPACLSLFFDYTGMADAIGGFAVFFMSMALGAAFRYRGRARQRALDQVRLVERERLARDLHDTVAHHVSAIAIRAQAGLATSAADPDAATDALRVIEAEASRTLAEMRAMVHYLRRDEPADLAPNPGIADLERLVRSSTTLPPVEVEIAGDVESLPEPVSAAIYRMAQESVTNARRHARHASRIEVRVDADDASVHLEVRDDGDSGQGRPVPAPGYGIIGMIERADLLGGTCTAGPDPDRGWTVTAVLPRNGSTR